MSSRRSCRAHPFREGFAEQLMLALYRCGRQVEALRVYQAQRDRLAEDLGIDPGPALSRMQERVLAQDADLLAASGSATDRRPEQLPLQRTSFVGRGAGAAGRLGCCSRGAGSSHSPGHPGPARLAWACAWPSGSMGPQTERSSCRSRRCGTHLHGQRGSPRALDLRESADETPLDVACAYLRERRMLLLLDNFEHLAEAACQVGELFDRAPDIKVLVTSRSPLGLIGEQEYPVPTLGLPPTGTDRDAESVQASDAAVLFRARAHAIDPSFDIVEANAAAVAEVTRHLDGLPLAIELAAARIRLHTPQELLERLVRRLDVLALDGPEVEERHRTMRGAIAWSYELLDPEEQAFVPGPGCVSGGLHARSGRQRERTSRR